MPGDFGEAEGYTASIGMNVALDIDYVRDAVGRITQKTEAGRKAASLKLQGPSTMRVYQDEACTSITAEYFYYLNSNRIGGFTAAGAISATYDEQDRLLSYNGTTYSYTSNGELQVKTDSSGETYYDYDALGNLREAILPDGTDIDYVIDGLNRRVAKKVDGVVVQAFLYENQLRPTAELDASGNVVSRFVYGDKVNVPEYMLKGGETYRLITDHLGSPRLVVDINTGTIAQAMTYDEWGNVLADSNPGFQPFGFAGGIWDVNTGLVRFGARDYDPRVGRWTAKDPIGFQAGDVSLLGYCFGDPMNRLDPSGRLSMAERAVAYSAGITAIPLGLMFGCSAIPTVTGTMGALLVDTELTPLLAPAALGRFSAIAWGHAVGVISIAGFTAGAGVAVYFELGECDGK